MTEIIKNKEYIIIYIYLVLCLLHVIINYMVSNYRVLLYFSNQKANIR